VEELLRRRCFALVIPCTDRTLLPLERHRELFGTLTRLAIPGRCAMAVFFDKLRTREAAAALGIAVPPAVVPTATSRPDEIVAQLGLPVVVKPRRSVRPDALHRQATVRLAETAEQLGAALSELAGDAPYVEGFVPGYGLGVSVLAERGVIRTAFQHHRIHQAARGGSSAYRVSAALSPDLLAACGRLCAHTDFTGLAMFEFRRNPLTDAAVLLEVNARPWGSMPLPVALGVDFPAALYRLLVDGSPVEARGYRPGVYGRNFDLDVSFALAAASRLTGRVRRGFFLARWMAGFCKLPLRREKLDTLVGDDPAPAIAEFRQLAARGCQRLARGLPGHLRFCRAVARARLRRALQRARRQGKPAVIAFICYGNICRSAFAERALARALADRPERVTVRSAGTYQVSGRPSPPEAREAAGRLGVDLLPHLSQRVTAELLQTATVLIAFDRSNVEALRARFPGRHRPIILLGALLDTAGPREIDDPYGGGPAAFDHIFGLIEQGVRVVRDCVAETLGPRAWA
jgi:protein-tyrosine-phosphatase/predicted ATP-grasp superfamily ATP-dependent carboligase